MTDRSSSFRRDTTSRSSREISSRSRPLDLTRQSVRNDTAGQGSSSSGYNREYNTYDVRQSGTGYQERPNDGTAGQGGSSRGYDRGYNTHDVRQSGTGYQERPNDGTVGQGGSSRGYDRGHNTHDARRGYSNDLSHSHIAGQSSTRYSETRKDIEEVIKQRDGKTSFGSEISLGYKTERYPMRSGTKEEAQAYLDGLSTEERKEFDFRYKNGYGTGRGHKIYDHWADLYYR